MAQPSKIGIGMHVYFGSFVFSDKNYVPFYDAYKGHKFSVVDIKNGHIGLRCIDDETVIVAGYVHENELKRA